MTLPDALQQASSQGQAPEIEIGPPARTALTRAGAAWTALQFACSGSRMALAHIK